MRKQIKYYCPICKIDKYFTFTDDDLIPTSLCCPKCMATVWRKGEPEEAPVKATIADGLKIQIEELTKRIEKMESEKCSMEKESSLPEGVVLSAKASSDISAQTTHLKK